MMYDFQCVSCGHTFEDFVNKANPEPTSCPVCGGDLKKLIGLIRDWFPHPLVFQPTEARHKAVAELANRMVQNNDDTK